MGIIRYDTASTFTGFIADESHSLDWLFSVPGGDAPDADLMPEGAVVVMGSTTYSWVLDHTCALSHPQRWFADFGARPVFVFTSRELQRPEGADVRFVSGPVLDALPALRAAAEAGDIWIVGGGDLAGQFHDVGALDEIAVSIAPAALSSGAPLFPRRVGPDRLTLVEARAVGAFARVRYRVAPAS
ncbi:dihydrofolate reductase family protein [Microbacterium chocolatum]|uniref:dihydrofolate reductase family protein n=1 Tax=Microbacterium aurantiacum TaxID=162393 RepID=UPI00338E85A7